jgi:putative transposase
MCGWLGCSRQAYYQHQHRQQARERQVTLILAQVRAIRHRHPRLGTRKLLARLRPRLRAQGQHIGRDRLFELLRQHQLLIWPKRRRRPRTTGVVRTCWLKQP